MQFLVFCAVLCLFCIISRLFYCTVDVLNSLCYSAIYACIAYNVLYIARRCVLCKHSTTVQSSQKGCANYMMFQRSCVAGSLVSLSPHLIENLFSRKKNFLMKSITKFKISLINLTWCLKVKSSHYALRIGRPKRHFVFCLFENYLSIPPKLSGCLVGRLDLSIIVWFSR